MIDRLVDASANHRFVVLIVGAVLAIAGWRALKGLPLDALPDPTDKQVIVSSRWNRNPDVIDAQVTRPIVSALLGAPRIKAVRGVSDAGSSLVYAIFDDDVDLYWARARTLEYLSGLSATLPEGVRVELAPDATSLGWVLQYVLVDRSGRSTLADLRSYQDWYLSPRLRAVPGVAEVATVGGFVRQYNVAVDQNRLLAYGLSIDRVVSALKASDPDISGPASDTSGGPLIVRGTGASGSVDDLEELLVATADDGTPVRVKDVAHVDVGTAVRRGVADMDGAGGVVSGIVVMRQGENAVRVIDRVHAAIKALEPSLPEGVAIETIYDRSDLIRQVVDTFTSTVLEVMATVAIVILLFLLHGPSAIVPLVALPVAVLITCVALDRSGISANIMSFGGLAIAVGALVDASIVVVEQTHKRIEEWNAAGRNGSVHGVIRAGVKEVARPSFFALLIIAISFLPVLTFDGEIGRLFRPLVYAKSIAMLVGAILAVTFVPALRLALARTERFTFGPRALCNLANAVLVGTVRSEQSHAITRRITAWYEPVVRWSIRRRATVFSVIAVAGVVTVPVALGIGSELMPPFQEGAILYMPVTMPDISVADAEHLLQATDRRLKAFPEVEHVIGKAGHADSATDPAPLSMIETTVVLRPPTAWRRVPTWYSSWAPDWMKPALRHLASDHISQTELLAEMNEALAVPGVDNNWSMPIRGRIDMLATGVRTPLGIKVTGADLTETERLGSSIASALRTLPATRNATPERIAEGPVLRFNWDLAALAQAGLTAEDANATLQSAIGGETVTNVLRGVERYPVNVRYAGLSNDRAPFERVLITVADRGRPVSLASLARVDRSTGPLMIRNDDGQLTSYVYVNVEGEDYARYIAEADRRIRSNIQFPPGYSFSWTGQYETMQRTQRDLMTVIPLTVLTIALLLYMSTRSAQEAILVLLAVPFSAIGAVWALYLLGYQLSVAVWVGIIALLGVDAETGVFMLMYLDHAYERACREHRLNGSADLEEAILEGAAGRVRPKFMTVLAMLVGLVPVMWSTGPGAEFMKRVAAPLIGGIMTSFALELVVYPLLYFEWKSARLAARSEARSAKPA